MAQAAGTVLGFIGIYLTVRHGTRTSNREKSFDAYIYFSEKFDDLAAKRRRLRDRFESGDRTLGIAHVRSYFKDYQNLLYREWELFRGGVVAREVFDSWALGTHRYLHHANAIAYFDKDGQEKSLLPMEGVVGVLERSKVADPDFMDYMHKLVHLPLPQDEKTEKAWRRQVARIVAGIGKSKSWTL